MKRKLLVLAAMATLAGSIHAQSVYGGLGLPGLVTLGYAHPLSTSWGMRGEYAGGLSINKDGVRDGVNVTGSFKAQRAGIFADWYPFDGGFRLVGGVTANDIKADFVGVGSGNATINGKTVSMVGQTFNVNLSFPSTSPYLGIGYGHQSSTGKGLGFYADLGVMFGTFKSDVNTSLVANGLVTQADVDAQTKTMRDSISSVSALPSISVGVTYRY